MKTIKEMVGKGEIGLFMQQKETYVGVVYSAGKPAYEVIGFFRQQRLRR